MTSIAVNVGTVSLQIVPNLKLVEMMESEFGALQILVRNIKAGLPLEDHKRIIQLIFQAHNTAVSDNELESLIKAQGIIGLIKINVEVIAACLTGIHALESFFEETPGLGKLSTKGNTT